jgi:hypothetical protein
MKPGFRRTRLGSAFSLIVFRHLEPRPLLEHFLVRLTEFGDFASVESDCDGSGFSARRILIYLID